MNESIPSSDSLSYRRSRLRGLTDGDPVCGRKSRLTGDGKIVVEDEEEDKWHPGDYDYANNGFLGPIVASEQVLETEGSHHTLSVEKSLISEHRQNLRVLAHKSGPT